MKSKFISLIIPIVVLVIWDFVVRFDLIPNTLIATPTQVLFSFINLLFSGKLIMHALISFLRLVIGYLIGALMGVGLGILVGLSKTSEKLVSPFMQLIAPIPPIAWIPLLIVFLVLEKDQK